MQSVFERRLKSIFQSCPQFTAKLMSRFCDTSLHGHQIVTIVVRGMMSRFALSHLGLSQIAPYQFAPMVKLSAISPRVINRYTMQSLSVPWTFNQALKNKKSNFILLTSEAVSPICQAFTPTLRGMYSEIHTFGALVEWCEGCIIITTSIIDHSLTRYLRDSSVGILQW